MLCSPVDEGQSDSESSSYSSALEYLPAGKDVLHTYMVCVARWHVTVASQST